VPGHLRQRFSEAVVAPRGKGVSWSFRLGLVFVGTLGALATGVLTANGHALLQHSDPQDGAELQRAPAVVTLTFTEEPEAGFAVVQLLDTLGKPVPGTGQPTVGLGHPDTLQVALGSLTTGVYTLSWRVVSRVDGHVTGGTFAFGVGVSPLEAPRAEISGPVPSPIAVPAKVAFYVGLMALLGGPVVWALIARPLPPGAPRLLWLCWVLAALGLVFFAEAQRIDAGVGWTQLFGSTIGLALWARALPLLLAAAGIVLVGVSQPGPARFRAFILVGMGASTAMLAHVSAGHAGAAASWREGKVVLQWAHFMAGGVWLGGLAALLVAVRGAPDDEKAAAVRRYSAIAGIALGVVVVTGVVRAVDTVGAWGRLLTTPFGRLVLLKSGCWLILAALGATNRYWSIPAAQRTLRRLRVIGGSELAVALGVLVVTGFLTVLPPATYTQDTAAQSARLILAGNDFATSVRATLEIAPATPGPNRFIATVRDFDAATPVTADRVSLRFALVGRPDIAPSTLPLVPESDAMYRGQGSNLSLDGQWTVVLVIERGARSTEVPFTLTTRPRQQHIRVIRAPGQPTLYVIDFPDKRSLQIYLDPERPGPTQVHVTYFDATGNELTIARDITIRATPAASSSSAGRTGTVLPVRRFGAGHFIADATVGAGPLRLDVEAFDPQGAPLRATLLIQF